MLMGTLQDETLKLEGDYAQLKSVFGSYGDDVLVGSDAGVTLQGGHGEDTLRGGKGPDRLISLADGREPRIYQDYDPKEDDPDGEIIASSRTHFANQPIEADDILIGGEGADIFDFRVLINAKRDIILKHVRDDRTINWHGVAGENNEVHDHWVERLGNELIMDFNREEGDHIEISGHTVDVYRVSHVDTDDDGTVDSTVLYIQSNQGNAGAHNKDRLGTITALDALLTREDFTVTQTNYGLVETIDELAETQAARKGRRSRARCITARRRRSRRWTIRTKPAGSVLYVPGGASLQRRAGRLRRAGARRSAEAERGHDGDHPSRPTTSRATTRSSRRTRRATSRAVT